jgi:hypothetical protein
MNFKRSTVLVLILGLVCHSLTAQKLKDKIIGFDYKAPAELAIPDIYKSYKVTLTGEVAANRDVEKRLNNEKLDIPGLSAVVEGGVADLEFQLKSDRYKKIFDEIKISGEGADKRYYVKRDLVIPKVTVYVMQLSPEKKFLYKMEYESDTVIFKSKQVTSPDALKGYYGERNVEPSFDTFLFGVYRNYLNKFRRHFDKYYTGYLFYIKEKEDIYDEYQDMVKTMSKDVWDGTIDGQLTEKKKNQVKDFIAKSEALQDYIKKQQFKDEAEFISAIHSNLALAKLTINDFNGYLEHIKAITQENVAMKDIYKEFANNYQNYTIRQLDTFDYKSFFAGNWKLVDLQARYAMDINNDGTLNKHLIGTELNDCIQKESMTFSGQNLTYHGMSKRDCLPSDEQFCWKYYNSKSRIGQYLGLGDFYNGNCDVDNKMELYFVSNLKLVLSTQAHVDPESDTTDDVLLVFEKE